MFCRRHAFVTILVLCVGQAVGMAALLTAPQSSSAQGRDFPYEHEMHLDADPVSGSRRIPSLLISSNGDVEIDLWCVSGTGRAAISGRSITIVPTGMRDNQCSPERLLMDKELLDRLTQVTSWRWEGDLLLLIGPHTLRYRPASN